MVTTPSKKFEVGSKVLILNPVIIGTVTEIADKPGLLGEYWHRIETEYGKLKHLGGCFERLVQQSPIDRNPLQNFW